MDKNYPNKRGHESWPKNIPPLMLNPKDKKVNILMNNNAPIPSEPTRSYSPLDILNEKILNNKCASVSQTGEVIMPMVMVSLLTLGLFFVLCGYRYTRSTLFAIGFIVATGVVYVTCAHQGLPHFTSTFISTLIGFLFGLIIMIFESIGFFVLGTQNGVLLASLSLVLCNLVITPDTPLYWVCNTVILTTAIVFGLLNLFWRKGFAIIATSLYGATLISIALDYYIEKWAMLKWIIDCIRLESIAALPCPYSWIVLVIWPCCSILGIIFQWSVTGVGIHHQENQAAMRRRTKTAAHRLTCEQREEMRQRKYRYLYQVRTAHGDVITQAYVGVRQQASSTPGSWSTGSGAGEASTLQSDSTHLTVLTTDARRPASENSQN